MVTVHIDLPIFSSPTEAFGYFSGPTQLGSMPQEGEPFPWPALWTQMFSEIFEEQSKQVWTVNECPHPAASRHVTMFGLVCRDRAQARKLVVHLQRCSGISFSEHELD